MRRTGSPLKRGTTLIEALVYCVIFGLVLSCIYWVLIASMRYYHIANDSIELQQSALISMSTLTQELCESRASAIYSSTDPDGILFCSARDSKNHYTYNPLSTKLYWQKWVCYYVGTSGGVKYLYRKERKLPNPAETPATIAGYDTVKLFAEDTGKPRTVGKYIDSLTFTYDTDPSTTEAPPAPRPGEVGIKAVFNKSPNPEKGNQLEIRSEAQVRN